MKKIIILLIFFIISIQVSAQTRIRIVSPRGGEQIPSRAVLDIQWASQFVTSVNILLSFNNGLNWEYIDTNLYSGGHYSWKVPDATSEQCFIKIENSSNTSIFDINPQPFKIVSTPPFSYFPISPGNKWFFSIGYDNIIRKKLEVQKDTILKDGFSYSKLNYYSVNTDSSFSLMEGSSFYLRKDGHRIIEYPDLLILDFNMDIGDSVYLTSGRLEAVFDYYLYGIVYGKYLTTCYFFSTPYDFYTYTDSIGFNSSGQTFRNYPTVLQGCEIDNKVYGNIITGIENQQKIILNDFCLSQNYPNPFNSTTKIGYSIPKTSFVTLKVYDILGREVAALVNGEKPAGNYEVEFNGNGLSSGIYFYKIQAGNFSSVKKMILVK